MRVRVRVRLADAAAAAAAVAAHCGRRPGCVKMSVVSMGPNFLDQRQAQAERRTVLNVKVKTWPGPCLCRAPERRRRRRRMSESDDRPCVDFGTSDSKVPYIYVGNAHSRRR